MKRETTLLALLLTALLAACNGAGGQSEAERNAPPGMKLVWHDEFNDDGAPAPHWSYERGFVRNSELQWYQPQNALCRDGCLVIEGRREEVPNDRYIEGSSDWRTARPCAHYTSASLNTRDSRHFLYGSIQVRARIPLASGSWPAIWTLGTSRRWPANGECDIMEFYRIKGVPSLLANTVVAGGRSGQKWNSKNQPLSHFTDKESDWAQKFHVWRMDWDSTAIKLWLDDELMNEIPLDETWNEGGRQGRDTVPYNPFHHPQYLLLNLALGATGGECDTTAFPMRYEIDWVRVYQTPRQIEQQQGLAGAFNPGKLWVDTQGNPINAHGGGLLAHNGRYYWYGEHKGSGSTNAYVGVTCYSSPNLLDWRYEGVALPASDSVGSPIERGCIMERPKVVYNARTGKFVMWLHLELKGRGYDAAQAAVAVSDTPQGPFVLLANGRPNAGALPVGMSAQQADSLRTLFATVDEREVTPQQVRLGYYCLRDLPGGQMARDQTVFVDDDGTAYHIFSSEENYTLNIARLSDDYTTHTGEWMRMQPGGHNEAPALFKKGSTYWMITSGCTGWAPNRARLFSAPSVWGPWTAHDTPCRGRGAELTFGGQSTYVQPVQGGYIFMADEWRPHLPVDSRYIWLPITFGDDGLPQIHWRDSWQLHEPKP